VRHRIYQSALSLSSSRWLSLKRKTACQKSERHGKRFYYLKLGLAPKRYFHFAAVMSPSFHLSVGKYTAIILIFKVFAQKLFVFNISKQFIQPLKRWV
jgi:hypothetical protein